MGLYKCEVIIQGYKVHWRCTVRSFHHHAYQQPAKTSVLEEGYSAALSCGKQVQMGKLRSPGETSCSIVQGVYL